jgi:glycosyltransferase involved in cell wall biosynthesis
MSTPPARWLLVSRPILGPALDGGPALLRELIPALPSDGVGVDYFGDPNQPLRAHADDIVLRVPRLSRRLPHRWGAARLGAEVLDRAAIGGALLARKRRGQGVHLFFDAGPVTERIAAGLLDMPMPGRSESGVVRRTAVGVRSWLNVGASIIRGRAHGHQRPAPVVQTLTCATGLETCAHLLDNLDATVALSDDTRARLIDAGVSAERVHRIHPGVAAESAAAIEHPGALLGRRAIVYAGELDVGATDRLIELARTLSEPALRGWTLIIACRPDQIIDAPERARLGRELAGAIGAGRVELLGEVEDMPALLRRCAIQLFVADKIHRRLDIPLVLLEGLREGLATIALDRGPVRELFAIAAAHGRELGARVDPTLGPSGLVRAIHELAERPETLLAISHDAVGVVRDGFSAARMAAEYASLHASLWA